MTWPFGRVGRVIFDFPVSQINWKIFGILDSIVRIFKEKQEHPPEKPAIVPYFSKPFNQYSFFTLNFLIFRTTRCFIIAIKA